MQVVRFSILFFALVNLVASSVIPGQDFALETSSLDNEVRDLAIAPNTSTDQLLPRMDVMDPGDSVGRGWTWTLVKFIPFVPTVGATLVQQASAELYDFYEGAFAQLFNAPAGASSYTQPIFLKGDLLSLLIKRQSGTAALTSDLVQSFLSYMVARLAYGGYRGMYIGYLRQVGGPTMFSVKLQFNYYWEAKGIEGLPGAIGLAALGF